MLGNGWCTWPTRRWRGSGKAHISWTFMSRQEHSPIGLSCLGSVLDITVSRLRAILLRGHSCESKPPTPPLPPCTSLLTAANRYTLFWAPPLADFLQQYHMVWLILMLILHVVEVIHIEKSRLRKHGTPRFSLAWWGWIIGTFFEGFGSFMRFDQAVEGLKAKKLKEKH